MVLYSCPVDSVTHFHAQLDRYRVEKQFCDFELRCGETTFPCHQVVLRSRARLSLETTSSRHVECRSVIPASAVEATLQFVYKLSVDIDCSNVVSLLRLAEQLNLIDLRTFCEQFLVSVIPAESNWFWLYECVVEFQLQSLRATVSSFLVQHFCLISEELVKIDLELAQEVLSSDQLPVSDEQQVLDVVRRWIHHKEDERRAMAADMLGTVRLSMMQLTAKKHRTLSRDRLFADEECQHLFDAALDFSDTAATRWSQQSASTRPRPSTGFEEKLIVVGASPLLVSSWDEAANQWTDENAAVKASLSQERCSPSISVVCDGKTIYAVNTEACRLYFCDVAPVRTDWKELVCSFQPRKAAECLLTDGFIYLVGGTGVDRMDMRNNKWSSAPAMPSQVLHPAVFFMNNKIYVIGGCDVKTNEKLRHIQVFNCDDEAWTCIPDIFPEGGQSMSAVCYERVVYLLANSGKLYQLDVATLESRLELDLAVDCTAATMAVFNGNAVVHVPSASKTMLIRLGESSGRRVSEIRSCSGSRKGRVHLFTLCTARHELHRASHKGQLEVAKVLFDKGADTNAKSSSDETPPKLATKRGRWSVAAFLRTRQEEKEKEEDERRKCTQSIVAFFQQNGRADVAKIVLDNNGDVNAKGASGKAPLHVASEKGHVDTVKLLLDRGANIEDKDSSRWDFTPLLWATWQGHVDVVRVLIDRGARVNVVASTDIYEYTPLHFASFTGHVDVVKVLVDRGAQLEAKATGGFTGFTALHLASYYGKLDVVKLFVDKGANVNAKDTSNYTPLRRATDQGHTAIVDFLRSRGGTE